MPKFGLSSTQKLETLDPRLQRVLNRAILDGPDFSIICGHRTEEDQNSAYDSGNSKKRFPESLHNVNPSRAVDIVPYGGKDVWGDTIRFGQIAGWILRCAEEEGVKIRWGGDWRQNWRTTASSFFDGGHFELAED